MTNPDLTARDVSARHQLAAGPVAAGLVAAGPVAAGPVPPPAPWSPRPRGLRPLARHYLEMVVAMVVGMLVLAPVWSWVLAPLGWSSVLHRGDVGAVVMATNMTVAMSAWMRFRGHGWASTAEMAAAMYLPFLLLLAPLELGLISEAVLMGAGHLLMLIAMAAAMLRRREEYTHAHHGSR